MRWFRSGTPRPSLHDQELFFRRLAMLLGGGVSLLEALRLSEKQSAATATIAASAADDVESGRALAESLAAHDDAFDELSLAVIGIGESSGTLTENLGYVAEELKKRRTLRRAVLGAAAYPAFVLAITAAITIFLAAYVFPKITPVFVSIGADLPFATRAMLAVSGALTGHPVTIVGALLAAVVSARIILRGRKARLLRDRWLVRLPIIGTLVRGCAIAGACRAFGLLMGNGEPVAEAANRAATSAGNLAYEEALHGFVPALAAGGTISACFASRPDLFPAVAAHLAEAGERSGTLSETFRFLAALHEEEVDEIAKGLGPALEPILLLVMGLVVGFVALSIITPIYALTSQLGG